MIFKTIVLGLLVAVFNLGLLAALIWFALWALQHFGVI